MIYVYTVISDGWDNLRSPALVSRNARYICFTNTPISCLPAVPPWEYAVLPDVLRAARKPKLLPHQFLPSDAEASIYHDGNFQLKVKPEELIAIALDRYDWAAHMHPCRDCVYEEANILLREKIGTTVLVEEQIARYRRAGYPEHGGLWANGLIVRRHTEKVVGLCEAWWKEFSIGCERDQLSFPYVRWNRMRIEALEGQIYQSPYMNFFWHAAWKDKPCNLEFLEQRREIAARVAKIREATGENLQFPIYEPSGTATE